MFLNFRFYLATLQQQIYTASNNVSTILPIENFDSNESIYEDLGFN